MYVGHAAIALALKSREPHVPLVPLALACYGPDWLDVVLMIPHPRDGAALYTHSVPSVLIGAVLASALYAVIARRPGAMQILLGWLLHWPADLVTGRKPLTGLDRLIGLDLYHAPVADVIIETVVVVIGCAMYARVFAHSSAQRRLVVAMGVALTLLQVGLIYFISRVDAGARRLSLAERREPPHLILDVGRSAPTSLSCTVGA